MRNAARRSSSILATTAILLLAGSCVPPEEPPPPPPPPRTVIDPVAGPAGTVIGATIPNDDCIDGKPWANLQVTLTRLGSAEIVAWGSGYYSTGPSLSGNTATEAIAQVTVPQNATPGVYLAYLTCGNYLQMFLYGGAYFTVTP